MSSAFSVESLQAFLADNLAAMPAFQSLQAYLTDNLAAVPAFQSLQAFLADHSAVVPRFRLVNVACALGGLYALLKAAQLARRRMKTTALRGPSKSSFLWGVDKSLITSFDAAAQYERWAEEYGGAYELPGPLGGKQIILCDPKAVAHMLQGDPWTYILPPSKKIGAEAFIGKGIVTAVGESHRRQRKALTPAFSAVAVRNLTPVFYDSAYKAKGVWESMIESNGGRSAVIEVQSWMNHIALDAIGIGGFSHDFGALDGKPAAVEEAVHAFGTIPSQRDFHALLSMLAIAIPVLQNLPSPLSKHITRLNETIGEIADELLSKARKEKAAGVLGEKDERSILGLLIRAENNRMTREEVMSQAKLLIFAGYESTSITMTWALIQLAKNPHMQTKLRDELLKFGADPTYEQVFSSLPYLDAVMHETYRLHSTVSETLRMATKDDVIPLGKPVKTRSGKVVDHIEVAKGSYLMAPTGSMHRSTALWGPDAKEFNPERWLTEDGIPAGAREIQGQRHLLTFTDGPRTCLGKGFSIVEFKVVLAVLIKNFVFEFDGGPQTEIELASGVFVRPRVVGEEGISVPLRVRRFE